MASNTYSAIVSDIDGTLLKRFDSRVSERMRSAARRAMEAGCLFSIATGRMFDSAWKIHREIGANGIMICHQGAMAVDAVSGETLREARLLEDVAAEAISFFTEREMRVRVYLKRKLAVSAIDDDHEAYASRNGATLLAYSDLLALAKHRPLCVLGIADPESMDEQVLELRGGIGNSALITRSLPHFCEVASPNAGKDKALQWISERQGISKERFVAFGDGLGDVDMLKWAGLGIAVGTDDSQVLESADEAVSGPEKHGVGLKINDMLDSGMLIGSLVDSGDPMF